MRPHEDIAEEFGNEIVGVHELDWSGREGAYKLELCVTAGDSLEELREGQSHVLGDSVQECRTNIGCKFCVRSHPDTGRTAEEQVILLRCTNQCVKEGVATLLKFLRFAFNFLCKIKTF